MQVAIDQGLLGRLLAWAAERFPAVPNLTLSLLLFGAALICGRDAAEDGAIALSLRDAAGVFAVYSWLLMLRIFDEHKDYTIDLQNHPQRVLQRGIISLRHLKYLGLLAFITQLAVSLAFDHGLGAVTARWLLVFGWSALMAKEFFIGEWLARRLLLYAISHMIVLPMAVLWLVQMGAGQGALPASAYLLALIAFLNGASFEIGRKLRAPADERPTVDSYTKALGQRGAVYTLLGLTLGLETALVVMVLRITHGGLPIAGILIALLAVLLPGAALIGFLRAPSGKAAKGIEAAIALQTLIVYGLLIGLWLVRRGAVWT